MNFLSVFSPEDTVIIQDDLHITAEEFQSISKKVAGYVSEKFQSDEIIGVKSDNSVYGLMLAVGASLAGKHVLPLSKMNDGQLNDYAIEETNCQSFIGYGTDLDHSDISKIENLPEFEPEQAPGDFIFLSSGSTGKPKIHLNNCINMDKQEIGRAHV